MKKNKCFTDEKKNAQLSTFFLSNILPSGRLECCEGAIERSWIPILPCQRDGADREINSDPLLLHFWDTLFFSIPLNPHTQRWPYLAKVTCDLYF